MTELPAILVKYKGQTLDAATIIAIVNEACAVPDRRVPIAHIAPMELRGTERGWEMLEQSGDERRATQEAYESIADAVALIYEHLRETAQEARQRKTAKNHDSLTAPARNVACPCGSGLKYKRCCGKNAPPQLNL